MDTSHAFFSNLVPLAKRKSGPAGKTCLTCRRRHKKCDQTRPTCERCRKSGFICSGYDPPHEVELETSPSGLEDIQAIDVHPEVWITTPWDHSAPHSHSGSASTPSSTIPPQPLLLFYSAGQTPLLIPSLPPRISIINLDIGKLFDCFMTRYQRLIDMSFYPSQDKVARAYKTFSQRLQTRLAFRWSLSICIKLFDDMFEGTQPSEANFAMFRRWFEEYDEMIVCSSRRLTPSEAQSQLSGTLEIKLLALRTTNTINPIHFLHNYAPVFLKIISANPSLFSAPRSSTAIPLAHVLTSNQYEVPHFALLDLLCSMSYGIPSALEYDTSSPPPKLDSYPTEWVHGCPLELKIILARINKCASWSCPLPGPGWQDIEQQLLAWRPSIHSVPGEEAWKMIARLAVKESWRHMFLVYLYMAVCGVASDDARVASSVRQIFQIIDTVRHQLQPVTNGHFLMQHLIAGACTPHEKYRTLARSKLSNTIGTIIWLFPISKFVPVLDHLWQGAAANGRPIRWSDYLHSRRTVLPVAGFDELALFG